MDVTPFFLIEKEELYRKGMQKIRIEVRRVF